MAAGRYFSAATSEFAIGSIKKGGKQPKPAAPDIPSPAADCKSGTSSDPRYQPQRGQVVGCHRCVDQWHNADAGKFVGPGIAYHISSSLMANRLGRRT